MNFNFLLIKITESILNLISLPVIIILIIISILLYHTILYFFNEQNYIKFLRKYKDPEKITINEELNRLIDRRRLSRCTRSDAPAVHGRGYRGPVFSNGSAIGSLHSTHPACGCRADVAVRRDCR